MIAVGADAWRDMRRRARHLSAGDLVRLGKWLVLAPHPDDETLGAGILIAELAAAGAPPWVAFLTDGAASHVGAPDWPPSRIEQVRSDEARCALRDLGTPPNRRIPLGWSDSAPHPEGTKEFTRTRDRLAGLCRRENIHAIAVTWRGEPHIDHAAAFAVARAVQRHAHGRIAVFEFPVWGWTLAEMGRRTRSCRLVTLGGQRSARRARRAIQQHRTQVSPMIAGAATAFRLPSEMIALAGRAPAVLLQERPCHAS
jgi:LmbE family N-acetylglucosaminyl deacetylase